MNKTLHLPLKAKWYELIEKGIKSEEYREIKDYWIQRLIEMNLFHFEFPTREELIEIAEEGRIKEYFRDFNVVKFSYGYTKKTMSFEIDSLSIGIGKTEWGAEPNKKYFVIKLGRRLE